VSAEDVRIVREGLDRLFKASGAPLEWKIESVDALDRLAARLQEAERERDDAEQSWSMYAKEAEDANTRAEARLAEEEKRATENGRLAQTHWDRAEAAKARLARLERALRIARPVVEKMAQERDWDTDLECSVLAWPDMLHRLVVIDAALASQ